MYTTSYVSKSGTKLTYRFYTMSLLKQWATKVWEVTTLLVHNSGGKPFKLNKINGTWYVDDVRAHRLK